MRLRIGYTLSSLEHGVRKEPVSVHGMPHGMQPIAEDRQRTRGSVVPMVTFETGAFLLSRRVVELAFARENGGAEFLVLGL